MTKHIINRQIIDLKVRSEKNAFRLQQQVREVYLGDILPLLGEMLDELSGPGEVLRIDRLDLDLGTVQADRMGAQLKERLREALREQLRRSREEATVHFSPGAPLSGKASLSFPGSENFPQLVSATFSQRELLQAFFETGILPWWAGDETEAPDIDAIVVELLEKEAITTFQWLRALAMSSPAALRRMILQFEVSTRRKIVAAAPEEIVAVIRRVVRQVQQLREITSSAADAGAEEQVVFSAVLTLPAENVQLPAPSAENAAVPELIRIFSTIAGTPQETIRGQVYAGMLSTLVSNRETVTALPVLTAHFIAWEKDHPELAARINGTKQPVLELLVGHDAPGIGKLAEIIEQALKKSEERRAILEKQVKQEARQKKKKKSLTKTRKGKSTPGYFSPGENQDENEEAVSQASMVVSPEPAPVSDETTATLVPPGSKTGTEKAPAKPGRKPAPGTTGHFQQPQQNAESESAQETPVQRKSEQAETSTVSSIPEAVAKSEKETPASAQPETVTTRGNEQPEEVNALAEFMKDHPMLRKTPAAGMTRFGGLVLIAPFLPAFFAELKLVTDGQFPGDAERHKAIHLLNFIASGKTKAPEYALLLHKLLCGMEITAPVPKTMKLSAAEKKEALFLLDDIAEQWTALRGSSGEAIRATFMRRNGILEKKEHGWLLRVEKAPMDIMLETFPWGISIIKAPWMQQLLHVEW